MTEIKITKMVRPLANRVVVTADKYGIKNFKGTNIVDTTKNHTYKEYQTVVAVGPTARFVEVGDMVMINPSKYAVRPFKENSLGNDDPSIQKMRRETKYIIPTLTVNDTEYLLLSDQDFEYVIPKDGIEEYEPNPVQVVDPIIL